MSVTKDEPGSEPGQKQGRDAVDELLQAGVLDDLMGKIDNGGGDREWGVGLAQR